jgi:hypothetical protein
MIISMLPVIFAFSSSGFENRFWQGAEGNGETPFVKAEVPWSAAYGLDWRR